MTLDRHLVVSFFHQPVIPLADYYIIIGVVYQAPDLSTVISSRAVRTSPLNPLHFWQG